MIYEVRTYSLKPRMLPEFEKRFGEALPTRLKYSPLAAFFHTDVGPLNQVIHIWPYESMDERNKIRADAVKEGAWPPKVQELIDTMRSEIFIPYPFSPLFKEGKMGPIFEWREYTLRPGTIPGAGERWEPALPARTKLSPLVVVMHNEFGDLNKFVHIWAYESMNHRSEVRAKAVETGVWPPKGPGDHLVSQENKICLPAAFSPLQ